MLGCLWRGAWAERGLGSTGSAAGRGPALPWPWPRSRSGMTPCWRSGVRRWAARGWACGSAHC